MEPIAPSVISTLTSERKVCENIADATQRQQCFQDAVDRAQYATQSVSFPPPIH